MKHNISAARGGSSGVALVRKEYQVLYCIAPRPDPLITSHHITSHHIASHPGCRRLRWPPRGREPLPHDGRRCQDIADRLRRRRPCPHLPAPGTPPPPPAPPPPPPWEAGVCTGPTKLGTKEARGRRGESKTGRCGRGFSNALSPQALNEWLRIGWAGWRPLARPRSDPRGARRGVPRAREFHRGKFAALTGGAEGGPWPAPEHPYAACTEARPVPNSPPLGIRVRERSRPRVGLGRVTAARASEVGPPRGAQRGPAGHGIP